MARPSTPGLSATRLPVWRRIAIAIVMTLHTAVFLTIAASIVHIFYAGVTNRTSRWTKVAISLSLAECAVFVAYRFRCPLRTVAESLGAESGQVTDIFLPRWLADRIPWVFTPMLVVGIGGLIRNRRRNASHPPSSPVHQAPLRSYTCHRHVF